MGILNNFLKDKEKQESELINALYERTDKLSAAQLTELLRYLFLIFGTEAAGFMAIRVLIQKINRHIGCEFTPKEKKDFERWLLEFFAKTDIEKQRAVFVTAALNVSQLNIVSGSHLMMKIDEALEVLKKTPEFDKLKKGESKYE